MVNPSKPKTGISVPAPVDAESILHELEALADILDEVSVRMHVLEYHFRQLEAYEIVAGAGQTSAKAQYTVDELAGMVSTYFTCPLQMASLWSMFGSSDPVQQQDAVRCVLAAKRAQEAPRVP